MEIAGESTTHSTDNVENNDLRGPDDAYCSICGRDQDCLLLPCSHCPKTFHQQCHRLIYGCAPDWDSMNNGWKCSPCISREPVPVHPPNDTTLSITNPEFKRASRFVTECYKLPDIRSLRWKFPEGYLAKYGVVPFNLKYIVARLHMGMPEYFKSPLELLQTFRQMFDQALLYYKEDTDEDLRGGVKHYFRLFLELVEKYYPEHREMFADILLD